MTDDSKKNPHGLMSLKEALVEQAQIEIEWEEDDNRRAATERERLRLLHETSVICKHDTNVQYIAVDDLRFQLCPDCVLKVMNAMLDNHDERTNGLSNDRR